MTQVSDTVQPTQDQDPALYHPAFVPLWERLMAPGAIAASVVAVVLVVMALIIVFEPPQKTIVVYEAIVEKPPEKEKEREMDIKKNDVEIELETEKVSDILIKDVVIEDKVETADNDPSEMAKGEPDQVTMIDNNDLSFLDLMGAAGKPAGRHGFDRGGLRNTAKGAGASKRTESSVDAALEWLHRHQSSDGSWSLAHFDKQCRHSQKKKGRCSGSGDSQFDLGGSSLALLAYTGRGLDHLSEGRFKPTIQKAKDYLIKQQSGDGCFGQPQGQHLYNQSLATFALADLLAMSNDTSLVAPVQKGIDYLTAAQNRGPGPNCAWRYNDYNKHPEAKSEAEGGNLNDTSVTTWVVMALKTARSTGHIKVDEKAFEGARNWLDHVYEQKDYMSPGVYGYNRVSRTNSDGHTQNLLSFAHGRPYATTACGMFSRIFLQQSKGVMPAAKTLMQELPDWDGQRDMYYWYYGSLAMFQVGGDHWHNWNDAMKPALTKSIEGNRSQCTFGSWDPKGTLWGEDFGGRVYTTAIGALTLEVYYRYPGQNKDQIKDKEYTSVLTEVIEDNGKN